MNSHDPLTEAELCVVVMKAVPPQETISPRTAEWKCCYDERRFSKESGEHVDNLEDDVWDIVVRDALDTATGKNTLGRMKIW